MSPNDAGDADKGPNNKQNFPVLSQARSTSGNTTVRGQINSRANASFRIEFFANNACDASKFGEGQRFLGARTVTTNAGGNASFTATFATAVAVGRSITATATDGQHNTSEFSRCVAVTP